MTHAYLYRTFEYVDHASNGANIEVRITFNYSPGRPAKIYGDPSNCYPAEPAEREYVSAERESVAGKWVQLVDGEWLDEWCVAVLEAADEDDLVRALPEREEV